MVVGPVSQHLTPVPSRNPQKSSQITFLEYQTCLFVSVFRLPAKTTRFLLIKTPDSAAPGPVALWVMSAPGSEKGERRMRTLTCWYF